MVIILMGVSGAGKSTIGQALATRLCGDFLEGDGCHPASNIRKMRRGVPLSDHDRAEWLDNLSRAIVAKVGRESERPVVISCSALKRSYRTRLREVDPNLQLVYLAGSQQLLGQRLAGRRDHFMPPQLLASQLAILEPPAADEHAIVVDVSRTVDEVVDELAEQLIKRTDRDTASE